MNPISRREFAHASAAVALGAFLPTGPATAAVLPLDNGWLFGGKSSPEALQARFDDQAFSRVTLPHCVARLSWQDWDPAAWQDVWAYRRHFSLPSEFQGQRVFVEFEGVMVGASPAINGHALAEHLGGYLPFRREITAWLTPGDNVLAVAVDSRWSNVPPEGSPKGPKSIDYLEPGGIVRSVRLSAVPQIFLSDVFAKPVKVLESGRQIEVSCSIDAAAIPAEPVEIRTTLLDRGRVVSTVQQTLKLEAPGSTAVNLTLSKLGNITFWDNEHPQLYDIVTTLSVRGKPAHEYRSRIGLREARFEVDGFFLNGRRVQLFGLNRHELFPYVGAAMPRRVMRRDAEILRREFNCNVVRCSHYPQSEAFLDACDELGLMVWEEIPGWQYLGDESWKELALRDVREVITRDRNHASIVIWGVRVNESPNDVALYERTTEIAHSLDDSRPASGSMTPSTSKNWQEQWHEDVFAFDDYHSAPDGTVGINKPLPGVPYMLAETVGQFNYTKKRVFDATYRPAGDVAMLEAQGLRHAQAHDRAMGLPRLAGVIAWCAFDYGSLINSYHGVKYPGVADVFRIPKLGASFYLSQVSPKLRAVILPNFYWDEKGPGEHAAIFSNCERLEVLVDGKRVARLEPDRANYPHLKYPPFFGDLAGGVDLRIDGYVGDRVVVSRSFSSDRSKDQFFLAADDTELIGDGSDATRVVFKTVDRFGAMRGSGGGEVTFEVSGPGVLVGDNPFQLADSAGVGAVWIKSAPGASGRMVVTAVHSMLGKKSVTITANHYRPLPGTSL